MVASSRALVALAYVGLTVAYVFARGNAFPYPSDAVEAATLLLPAAAVGAYTGSWWALALPFAACLVISLVLLLFGSSEDVSNIWLYWVIALGPMLFVAIGVGLRPRAP